MSRSVLVTGGATGIGLAIARAFAAQKDNVAITYRTTEPPETEGLFAVRCDVTDADQVEDAVRAVEEQQGPVEVLVSSAGITRDSLLVRMKETDFTEVLDTNLTGAFLATKAVSRHMLKSRKGRILYISSASALYGQAGQANYTASKAGLIGMARSLAREFAKRNVTVNVLSPGLTDTRMLSAVGPEKIAELSQQVPLGRLASPQEIAEAALFLTSPAAGYITGHVLPVDGGASMGH